MDKTVTTTSVVVDVECFRYRNQKCIVKEIAVAAPPQSSTTTTAGVEIDSISLKPPTAFDKLSRSEQKSCEFYSNKLHFMKWESGSCDYDKLYVFVKLIKQKYPNADYFAKGLEKCEFLEDLFKSSHPFTNLDDLGCPKVDKLLAGDNTTMCCPNYPNEHGGTNHCAFKKAFAFSKWLLKKKKQEEDEVEAIPTTAAAKVSQGTSAASGGDDLAYPMVSINVPVCSSLELTISRSLKVASLKNLECCPTGDNYLVTLCKATKPPNSNNDENTFQCLDLNADEWRHLKLCMNFVDSLKMFCDTNK